MPIKLKWVFLLVQIHGHRTLFIVKSLERWLHYLYINHILLIRPYANAPSVFILDKSGSHWSGWLFQVWYKIWEWFCVATLSHLTLILIMLSLGNLVKSWTTLHCIIYDINIDYVLFEKPLKFMHLCAKTIEASRLNISIAAMRVELKCLFYFMNI